MTRKKLLYRRGFVRNWMTTPHNRPLVRLILQPSIPSPEKNPTKTTRSRHRTRKDRYELKEVKEAKKRKKKKKKNEDPSKKERKRKRKEKSGAALMHDFRAKNVAHDSLTVGLVLAIALRILAVATLVTDCG